MIMIIRKINFTVQRWESVDAVPDMLREQFLGLSGRQKYGNYIHVGEKIVSFSGCLWTDAL